MNWYIIKYQHGKLFGGSQVPAKSKEEAIKKLLSELPFLDPLSITSIEKLTKEREED